MKMIIFLSIIAFILVACEPSQRDIQAAIVETQLSWTPTLNQNPSKTLETEASTQTYIQNPPPIANSCPDRGWQEIETYLKQFNATMNGITDGTNSSAESYIITFDSFRDKVSSVEIDPCSDHARQSIVDGMTKEINAVQIIASGYARIDAAPVFIEGVSMIDEGISELAGLGIQITYK